MKNEKISNIKKIDVMVAAVCLMAIVSSGAAAQGKTKDDIVKPVESQEQPSKTTPKDEAKATDKAPTSRITGDIPENPPNVSINAQNESINTILQNVAKQAQVDIVIDPSLVSLQRKMTIQLKKKSFVDVLDIILQAGDLQGTFKTGILFVNAATAPENTVDVEDSDSSDAFLEVVKHRTDLNRDLKRHTRHDKNKVQMGTPVHIKAGEEVDDAVAIGASLKVDGTVNGDAVAVGGDLDIGKAARVRGDAVAVGGNLNIQDGAVVEGEQVSIGIPLPIASMFKQGKNGEIDLKVPPVISNISSAFTAFSFLGTLLKSALLFVLAIAVTALAPKRTERVRDYFAEHPWYSMLAGLVILLSLLPVILILLVTIIGIPLIPLFVIALMILMILGMASIINWIGYKIPLFTSTKTRLGATALGAAALLLVGLIPFVGPFIMFLLSFMAAGVALLSRFGAEPKL